jgi:hypothetical protein
MTNRNNDLNDDLSDLLGTPAPVARELPQSPEFVRVREAAATFTESCPKCGGSGQFRGWSGRAMGPCFACKGKGSKAFKTSAATRQHAREGAEVRKVRAAEGNLDAFKVANPEMYEWIVAKAPRFDFAASMFEAVKKYGDLTEGQRNAVLKCMARDADREAAKAAPAPAEASYPNLRAAFDAVVARGAKKAQITIGDVNVSLAGAGGRNPGALYVKVSGRYAGKIVGTAFRGSQDAPADLAAKLAEIEANPTEAIKNDADRRAKALADGTAESMPCGCCGITLTDPVSVARGIGPICAGKWGF